MSPDGQRALLAGGASSHGCQQRFPMKRQPKDEPPKPLPDMFELDLNTMCWVQVCALCLPCFPCVPSLEIHPIHGSEHLSCGLKDCIMTPCLPDVFEVYPDAMCWLQTYLSDPHVSPPASQASESHHILRKQALCQEMQGLL